MTFFHLVRHFGCAMNPNSCHNFLAGSLAPSLRYCPICLAEHAPASYSLLWRFLVLPGCIEHGVRFLDQCGHCRSPLPLLRCLPQLTRCPTCQGELRACEPSRLSDDDVEPTDRYTNDLKMLLTPSPRPLEKEQAKLIGRRFQLLRQRRISGYRRSRIFWVEIALSSAISIMSAGSDKPTWATTCSMLLFWDTHCVSL